MPAKSKKQHQFMGMICAGKIPPPKGLTREKACEFVRGYNVPKVKEKKSEA